MKEELRERLGKVLYDALQSQSMYSPHAWEHFSEAGKKEYRDCAEAVALELLGLITNAVESFTYTLLEGCEEKASERSVNEKLTDT